MFFASKQKVLEARIAVYREQAAACVQQALIRIREYCGAGDLQALRYQVHEIHRLETDADNIRREIEVMMYERALFPESRGDILRLMEAMDTVPDQAEQAVRSIADQMLVIPPFLHPDLFQLLDIVGRCVDAMFACIEKLFSDFQTATALIGRIDALESEADAIQSKLIQQVFASDIRDMDKILLRDVINEIAGISDYAEDTGDWVRILVAKRLA